MHAYQQSPTQWQPLTNRVDLCQRLTLLQDSCKIHVCSRFCFSETIVRFAYIFSADIKFNIIIWGKVLFEICNIYRDDCCVLILIWYMYSSDRMFKDYVKNIVFRPCQMHFLNICLRRKKIPWFSSVILLNYLTKNNNRYWTSFETFAEIERDCKERQLNFAWESGWSMKCNALRQDTRTNQCCSTKFR